MSRLRVVVHALILTSLVVSRSRAASPDWVTRGSGTPTDRYAHAMAFDSAHGQVVLTGGISDNQYVGDTWGWNGSLWIRSQASEAAYGPYSRPYAAMAYDSARGRVVFFGGYDGSNPRSDTWEFDGHTWVQRTPVTSPPPRSRLAMAYDAARGRVVLFGGYQYGWLSDTWEWDGSNWTQRTPLASPPARYGHAMVYDTVRGRIVLFGGWGNGFLADTWEWDGQTWVQRTPPSSPPARYEHAMAFDSARGRTVLFGGNDGNVSLSDTWEWDGGTWVQRSPASSPQPRRRTAMAYDSARGRVVLFGGVGTYIFGDVWEWDGTTWTVRPPDAGPPARFGHAMTFDGARSRTVLFGGYGSGYLSDTWEWDGATWVQKTPAVAPPPRYHHAMAYDSARGRIVMFGGRDPSGAMLADTWEWDGSSWQQLVSPTSPTARYEHTMVYDAVRGRVVLFGGYGTTYLGDTWEWDGTSWNVRSTATSPSARDSHAMAYDSARGVTVLFGGYAGDPVNPNLGDTWEWDGGAWTQRTPPASPPSQSGHVMTYDSSRARIVLFGTFGPYTGRDRDTWEFDGVSWSQVALGATPESRSSESIAYDGARGRVVLFGGLAGGVLSDTWEYGLSLACAYAQSVAAFAPGSGGSSTASDALGPPDQVAAALGIAGSLVVGLAMPVTNGPGTDLVINEVGADPNGLFDNYRIEAGDDGVNFTYVRDCRFDRCQIDLLGTGINHASYVRITDVPNHDYLGGGVRVDAALAMSCSSSVELCNGIDDDGDGIVPGDEIDHDGDGYVACKPWVGNNPDIHGGGDCNDADGSVRPGAQEVCNGVDDDCNGLTDDASAGTLCDDANTCTVDICNGAAGCSHPDSTLPCDDGNLCTQTDTCQAGVCVGSNPVQCGFTCPPGFAQVGATCQKTYDIGSSLLDNLGRLCDSAGTNRYNDCNYGNYGFHWTDLNGGLTSVTGVNVQLEYAVRCNGASSSVMLNGVLVGHFGPVGSCDCVGSNGVVLLPNLAGEDYVMSGVNTISIIPGGSSCEGLSQGVTLGNNFARVTVAYAASTIPCRVGTCDPATGGCGLSNSPDGTTCSDGDACTQNDGCQTGACVGTPITAPPETTDLVATADKATYDWAAASYATRYDVVRGSLAAYPVGPGGDDETCFDNLPAAMLTDASVPAPGSGYWYVSRGENACGIGTFGAQSDGSPRITTTCP